jgi:hypothetical protein
MHRLPGPARQALAVSVSLNESGTHHSGPLYVWITSLNTLYHHRKTYTVAVSLCISCKNNPSAPPFRVSHIYEHPVNGYVIRSELEVQHGGRYENLLTAVVTLYRRSVKYIFMIVKCIISYNDALLLSDSSTIGKPAWREKPSVWHGQQRQRAPPVLRNTRCTV